VCVCVCERGGGVPLNVDKFCFTDAFLITMCRRFDSGVSNNTPAVRRGFISDAFFPRSAYRTKFPFGRTGVVFNSARTRIGPRRSRRSGRRLQRTIVNNRQFQYAKTGNGYESRSTLVCEIVLRRADGIRRLFTKCSRHPPSSGAFRRVGIVRFTRLPSNFGE